MRKYGLLILAGIVIMSCVTTDTGEPSGSDKVVDGSSEASVIMVKDSQPDLFTAIENRDLPAVISEGDLSQTNALGDTALMIAAANGSLGITAFLLAEGADPNRQNKFGETALHYACENGFDVLANLLKNAGADPSLKDGFGVAVDMSGIDSNFYNRSSKRRLNADQFSTLEKELGTEKTIAYYDYYPLRMLDLGGGGPADWMGYVSENAMSSIESWLSMKDCTFPDVIPEPILPPSLVLNQDEWETNAEFEQKVKAAQRKRQQEIMDLQAEYQRAVEIRNEKVMELKNIQDTRLASVTSQRTAYIGFLMSHIFDDAILNHVEMDKSTGDLYIDAESQVGYELGTFQASGDRDFRKAAFQNLSSFSFKADPTIGADGSFSLSRAKISYNGTEYDARLTNESAAVQEAMTATIDLSTDEESMARIQVQSTKLVDRNAIGEITYRDGTQRLVGFDDDLEPLIIKAAQVPVDRSQWAFVIGAEKYLNTDDIIYARRSAELFAQTLVKVKGVPEGQVIALYDEKATSGNIKSQLQSLLEKGIREGDTVYFYYNGHGIPAANQQNEPYMLPTDMQHDYVTNEPFFKLENIYSMLESSKAGSVIVFMDSCFSGKTDGVSVFKGMAATSLAPKKVQVGESGNIAILASGQKDQFSNAWPDKGHRLFSYYVMKALLDGNYNVNALYGMVSENVSATSREIGGVGALQDPTVMGNTSLRF